MSCLNFAIIHKWFSTCRTSRRLCVLILGFFFTGHVLCQSKHYYFAHLTTEQGLSQNYVASIFQDSKGFMWFGTQAGLDRFDGVSFAHYSSAIDNVNTISRGFVNTIFENRRNGTLLIGSTAGLCKIAMKNYSEITRYKVGGKEFEENVVKIQGGGAERILIVTTRLIYSLDGDNLIPMQIVDSLKKQIDTCRITSFVIDSINGKGIVGTTEGLYVLELKNMVISKRIKLNSTKLNAQITGLFMVRPYLIVSVKAGNETYRESGSDWSYYCPFDNSKMERDEVYKSGILISNWLGNGKSKTNPGKCTAMLLNDSNSLWVGTEKAGLINFSMPDFNGFKVSGSPLIKKSMPSGEILSLFKSRDGTLWVGTGGGGLGILLNKRPVFFDLLFPEASVNYAIQNSVWAISKLENDDLLIGTNGNGIVKLSLGIQDLPSNYSNSNDEGIKTVRAIAKCNDTFFIGTRKGLYIGKYKMLNNYYKNFRQLVKSSVNCVNVIGNKIWVGTISDGIIIINKKDFSRRDTILQDEKKRNNVIRVIYPNSDNKHVYVGTDNGLFMYSLEDNSKEVFRKLDKIMITSITESGDSLWIGTFGRGFFLMQSSTGHILYNWTMRNGIPDNVIYSVVKDSARNIWMSSNNGIFVYNQVNSSFNHYPRKYGLQHDEFNGGAFSSFKYNERECVLFGGVNGVNGFYPSDLNLSKTPPEYCLIYETPIQKNQNIPTIIYKPSEDERIELDPFQNTYKLSIRIFDYQDPLNCKYKYSLGGYNDTLEHTLDEPITILRNDLKLFGKNVLKVRIRKSDGQWIDLPDIKLSIPVNLIAEYKRGSFLFNTLVAAILTIGTILFFGKRLRREAARSKTLANENVTLMALQNLVNELSQCDNIQELIYKSSYHLTSGVFFKFDYVVFYRVHKFQSGTVIIYDSSFPADNGNSFPAQLYNAVKGFPIKSNNVRSVAVEENIIIELIGEEIQNGIKAELDDSFIEKFTEENLIKYFIPVNEKLNSTIGINDSSDTMALIEVGCYKTNYRNFRQVEKKDICLYVSRFAAYYKKLTTEKKITNSNLLLTESINESKDEHFVFMQKILDRLCCYLEVDYGCIALASLDSCTVRKEDITVEYEKIDILSEVKGLCKDLLTYKSANLGVLDVSENIHALSEMNQFKYFALSAPIVFKDLQIGVFEAISINTNVFHIDNLGFVENILNKASSEYISKKFHYSVAELVSPTNIVTEYSEDIYPAISAIEKYFLCNLVSVWMIDYKQKKSLEYRQHNSSKYIRNHCGSYLKKSILLNNSMPEFECINVENENKYTEPFLSFAQKNNIKSIIHVPLRNESAKYGFINIYSKRGLAKDLLLEDRHFLELISSKTLDSYLTAKMLKAFSDISKSLTDNEVDGDIKMITDSAHEILHSDLVVLFQLDKNKNIDYENATFSGQPKQPDLIRKRGKSDFIEYLVSTKEEQFYEDDTKLPSFYVHERIVNDRVEFSFWRRESIMSLAVIPLKNDNQVIGLLCFNYKKQQPFSAYTRQLFKTFSSLASAAIYNTNNLRIIRAQRKDLEIKSAELQKHAFDALKARDEMKLGVENLIPSATATSYSEIVRAITHDIRNHLVKIERNLVKIKAEHLQAIRSSSDRIKLEGNIEIITSDIANTENLIDLFGPESFTVSVEDLFDVATRVKKLFIGKLKKNEQGINVIINKLSDFIPTIRCSKAEISMIMYNLVGNAINAIERKWKKDGKNTAYPEGLIIIEIDYDAYESSFILNVEDDGIGIDKKHINRIYDLGFTTRNEGEDKGLGIGLHFVRKTLSDTYSGSITCTTHYNKGTKFNLKFKQHE